MASIEAIVRAGKGSAGNWRVVQVGPGSHDLYHYDTRMLRWSANNGVTFGDIGRGSVSDQGGLQKAFAVLDSDYCYRRDAKGGGPRIEYLGVVIAARGCGWLL